MTTPLPAIAAGLIALLGILAAWSADAGGWPAAGAMPGLLIVPALLIWLASPWHWRSEPKPMAISWLLLAMISIGVGLGLGLATPAAAGAALAVAAVIRSYSAASTRRRALALAPWLILATPLFTSDFAIVGWWFRLTGAAAAGGLLDHAGIPTSVAGTVISLPDDDLVVAPACSGLGTLHILLVAGLVAATRPGQAPPRWFVLVPLVVVLAWVANVLRIAALGAIATGMGADAARGAMHDFGGLGVILGAAILALAVRGALQDRQPRRWPYRALAIVGTALVGLAAADLVGTIARDPRGRSTAVAWLLWMVPAVVWWARTRLAGGTLPVSARWLGSALVVALVGWVIDLRVLNHVALALAFAAWLPHRPMRLVWLAGMLAWQPGLAWWLDAPAWLRLIAALASAAGWCLIRPTSGQSGIYSRVRVAVAASADADRDAGAGQTQPPRSSLSWGKRVALAATTLAVAGASVVWSTHDLSDANQRVTNLPTSGLGLRGGAVAIDEHTKVVFGRATAIRHWYDLGGDGILLTVVDGTHDRHAVHDPLVCLRGTGWAVVDQTTAPVAGGTAAVVTITKHGETRQVAWWYSDGASRWHDTSSTWWHHALRRLSLGASAPASVMVLVEPLGNRSHLPTLERLFQAVPDLALL